MERDRRCLAALVAFCLTLASPPILRAQSFLYASHLDDDVAGFSIDPATGALTALPGSPFALAGEIGSTALAPSGRFLYATIRTTNTLAVFSVNAVTGALTVPPTLVASGGDGTVDVTAHPSGRFVYVTNFNSNTVSVFRVDPTTGALASVAGSPFATGGTTPVASAVHASGRFLYVTHSTSNNVAGFSIDQTTGALAAVAGSPFPAGGQNQGLAMDVLGRYLYVTAFIGSSVHAYAIDGVTGALSPVPGSPFATGTQPAGSIVDPTGRFVYTANIGADNVSGFVIAPSTGALSPITGSPFATGDNPGGITTDLTGRYAYVTNALSNNVSVYAIHPKTGALAEIAGSPFNTGAAAPWGLASGRDFTRGDFDLDGLTDILWRHDVSGENVLWYMNGAVLSSGTFTDPSALVDSNWKMVGTNDFNGNRETDILWRHDVSGENVLWYMRGNTLVGGEFLTPAALVDGNWKMAGTGDFNGDGKPDIAWHHRASGEIVLWYMRGSVLLGGTFTSPSALTDTNWTIVGVADFNNDGRPDILWRHDVSGENVVWFMAEHVLTSGGFTNTLVDPNWKIVAVGDFNSDRKNDIVWRHAVSGENVIWFMDGVTLLGGTFTTPPALVDSNWKMVGPR